MPKTSIQHDGEEVQIRVWVSAEMYAQIAIRSEESGVSKAAITRDLMLAGLRAKQRSARELDHLERLAYKSALETMVAGLLVQEIILAIAPGDNAAEKQEHLIAQRNKMQDRANRTLTKYLDNDD